MVVMVLDVLDCPSCASRLSATCPDLQDTTCCSVALEGSWKVLMIHLGSSLLVSVRILV